MIGLIQPEMILSPHSLQTGYEMAKDGKAAFGEVWLGAQQFNQFLDDNEWQKYSYDQLYEIARKFGTEYPYNHMPDQGFYEMYWYTMFFSTKTARDINGVDLRYQTGVYAEDDQFKMRMRMAGCPDTWAGRPNLTGEVGDRIVGIHQSHSHESHRRQQRESLFWNEGANRNRALFRDFCANPYTVANEKTDPWNNSLIISEVCYEINQQAKTRD